MGLDVHRHDKRLASTIKNLENSENISKKNKNSILKFKDRCLAEGLTYGRVEKYVHMLKRIAEIMNDRDLTRFKKPDILTLVGKIEQMPWSEWTKHDYKVAIKKFYKFLKGTEDGYPDEVRWIKTVVRSNRKKLPEELLTEDEVIKLIETADHPRDKAIISLLYETGCRAGEVLSLQIKHVEFNDFGGTILVMGKTGMRKVLIVSSVPYLATWIQMHPKLNGSESPLWVGKGSQQKNNPKHLEYGGFGTLLRGIGKRSGISKRIHPHLFRHSRATHMANHLTEAQMNQYFGWVQGSDMPATYVHLSGRDMEEAIKKFYGIEIKEERKETKIKPKKCPKCENLNGPGIKFCGRCGGVLDVQTAMEEQELRSKKEQIKDELVNMLTQDPKILRIITQKIKGTKIEKDIKKAL